MGLFSVYSDLVKFAAKNVVSGTQEERFHINDAKTLVSIPEAYMDGECAFQPNGANGVAINGWQFHTGVAGVARAGRDHNLFAAKWTKGDSTVYVANEAQWAGEGELAITIFADTREELEAFQSDSGIDFPTGIETDRIITQVF